MKLSQFTMLMADYPEPGHHLVYNTLSRAMVEVDTPCFSMLSSLGNKEPSASMRPVLQQLQTQGIVAPWELDEAQFYHKKFCQQRSSGKHLHAVILTTLECPMKCTYCYQKHVRTDEYMLPETMERTASWLEGWISKWGLEKCFITFYGGEPLMNPAAIEYIGVRIRKYCMDRRIRCHFAMITSGLLLTQDVAEKMKRLGIRHLQITLDGHRDTHDRRRPLKDGSGTFDAIMENLPYLVDHFSINILCNVDRQSVGAAYKLLDILTSQGFAGRLNGITFGPVANTFDSARKHHVSCPEPVSEDITLLMLCAASRGFMSDLRPKHKICGMLLPHKVVISPGGEFYTCPSFLGKKEYQAGSIDQLEDIGVHELSAFHLPTECLSCPYVPVCAGGCRFNALADGDDIQKIDCHRETLSHSLPLLLKAHHSLRSRDVQGRDFAEAN